MARITRETTCPGCGVLVKVKKARPNATKRMYCRSCRNHENYSLYKSMGPKYNLSFKALDKLYVIENCQCCGVELTNQNGSSRRQIDHCHNTGKVRGVICWECNSGIGKLGDDLQGVEKALAYLRQAEEIKYEARL